MSHVIRVLNIQQRLWDDHILQNCFLSDGISKESPHFESISSNYSLFQQNLLLQQWSNSNNTKTVFKDYFLHLLAFHTKHEQILYIVPVPPIQNSTENIDDSSSQLYQDNVLMQKFVQCFCLARSEQVNLFEEVLFSCKNSTLHAHLFYRNFFISSQEEIPFVTKLKIEFHMEQCGRDILQWKSENENIFPFEIHQMGTITCLGKDYFALFSHSAKIFFLFEYKMNAKEQIIHFYYIHHFTTLQNVESFILTCSLLLFYSSDQIIIYSFLQFSTPIITIPCNTIKQIKSISATKFICLTTHGQLFCLHCREPFQQTKITTLLLHGKNNITQFDVLVSDSRLQYNNYLVMVVDKKIIYLARIAEVLLHEDEEEEITLRIGMILCSKHAIQQLHLFTNSSLLLQMEDTLQLEWIHLYQ